MSANVSFMTRFPDAVPQQTKAYSLFARLTPLPMGSPSISRAHECRLTLRMR